MATYSSLQNKSISPSKSLGAPQQTAQKEKESWISTMKKNATISTKQMKKEVAELEEAGKEAIEGPSSPIKDSPDAYKLEEGQQRFIVEKSNPIQEDKINELSEKLIDWINDVLADRRIIVKDIEQDIFDGQILAMLAETLSNTNLGKLTEVTQAYEVQKEKLRQTVASSTKC